VSSIFSAIVLNALPMWRKHCGPHALADLRRKLEEEQCIYIIFPEGSRSRDGKMARFKPGLGMLVAETPAPVVPCFIAGTFDALPAHKKIPRPAPVRIAIGSALCFADVPNNREGWSQIAQSVESSVRNLAAQ
jgi:1-acyl-sn-glycerol-3-phosphate acyltransferase